MKRLLITLLLSGVANAHSQLPSEIKEYVVQPTNKFTIQLVNRYKTAMTYDIYEDGKPSLQPPITLPSGGKRDINIWLNTPPNEYAYKKVCTQPRLNGNVKVQMCSRIITYYPASSLEQ